jgi:uncharacterized protein
MTTTVVWSGVDEPRMEIAYVDVDLEGSTLRARGTQIGVAYELRYELEPGRLRAEVVGGPRIDIGVGESDFFDLAHSPLFNSLPIVAGLDGAADFVMTFVDVPSLEVERAEQRYEPLGDGRVRFRSGSFTAELEFGDDRLVAHYEGLARRIG